MFGDFVNFARRFSFSEMRSSLNVMSEGDTFFKLGYAAGQVAHAATITSVFATAAYNASVVDESNVAIGMAWITGGALVLSTTRERHKLAYNVGQSMSAFFARRFNRVNAHQLENTEEEALLGLKRMFGS